MSSLESLIPIIFGLAGMVLGSFSGLLIIRLPQGKPFVFTRSCCDQCGKIIPLYLNVPIFSFLSLRGKTKCCGEKIGRLHFVSELIMPIVFVINSLCFPLNHAIVLSISFFWFYTLSIIDVKHWIIPDILSWGAMPVCFCLGVYLLNLSYVESLAGFCFGFGFFYTLAVIYEKIRGAMGLGGGDIKLLGAIGLLIGWKGAIFTIFFSSLLGTIVGFAIILLRRSDLKQRVPYGPFLAIGAYCYLNFFTFFEKMIYL